MFIQEPPNYVDFSNTTGTKIICQARGVPLPNITWTKSNGEPIGTVPGLRQVSFDPISYLLEIYHFEVCFGMKTFTVLRKVKAALPCLAIFML